MSVKPNEKTFTVMHLRRYTLSIEGAEEVCMYCMHVIGSQGVGVWGAKLCTTTVKILSPKNPGEGASFYQGAPLPLPLNEAMQDTCIEGPPV